MATQAQIKPLALTLTSVTVHMPTPTTTTATAILTSLEKFLPWRIHSNTQTTGIMLNFDIYSTIIQKKNVRDLKKIFPQRKMVGLIESDIHLIKSNRVEHETQVHPSD